MVGDGTLVFVGVRDGPVVRVGLGVTVGGATSGVLVGYGVAVANGVTVGTRVNVAVGVRRTVGVRVGVRVGRGVRVLVGALVGTGGFVGGTMVTKRVVPGLVVSSTTIIAPAVPTVVGVGRLSTGVSGGAKSHATRAKSEPRAADTAKART